MAGHEVHRIHWQRQSLAQAALHLDNYGMKGFSSYNQGLTLHEAIIRSDFLVGTRFIFSLLFEGAAAQYL